MSNQDEMVFGDYEEEKESVDRIPNEGRVTLRLKGWEYKESGKGNKGVKFLFQIAEAENSDDIGFPVGNWTQWGTKFFRRTVLAIAGERIAGLTLTLEDVMSGPGNCAALDDLVGEEVEAELSHRKFTNDDGEEGVALNIRKFYMG